MTTKCPVLEFDQVVYQARTLPQMRLQAGTGLWLALNPDETEFAAAIGRLALGLERPDRGEVRFLGAAWHTMSTVQTDHCRARIGRVFCGTAWISNLNVDENILLPMLHHKRRTPAAVRTEAEALARRLGLESLPTRRPGLVPVRDLQRAQWVRALLGAPALLVLECPEKGVTKADVATLTAAVAERIQEGTAVLWISNHKPEWSAETPWGTIIPADPNTPEAAAGIASVQRAS